MAGAAWNAYLVVLATVAGVGVWVAQQSPAFTLGGDNATLTHPLFVDAIRQLREGRLPLWSSGRWGGAPLLGDPVGGLLYLPAYLGYVLSAPPHLGAQNLNAVLHLALLAAGVVWLLRGLAVPPPLAVVGALLVASSPTLVYVARSWSQYWAAMAWWPWLFGATVRLVVRGAPRDGVLAAVALAAQVYAGYPQFALYSGSVALVHLVAVRGRARRDRLALAGICGIAAVGLAMPCLLMAFDMIVDSVRTGPAGAASLAALDVLALAPDHWRRLGSVEAVTPLGFARLPPALVLLALVALARRDAGSRFFAGVAVVAAVLATQPAHLFRLLHSIPPFSAFGGPAKTFFLTAFLVPVLAASGLARLATLGTTTARLTLGALATAAIAPWQGPRALILVPAALLVPRRAVAMVAAIVAVSSAGAFLAASRALSTVQPFARDAFTPLLEHDPALIWPDAAAGPWVAIVDEPWLRQTGMNFGSLWGLEALSGVGPLRQRAQAEVLERADPRRTARWLQQLGAAVVVVQAGSLLERRLRDEGFEPLAPHLGLRALRAPGPVPAIARLVTNARSTGLADMIAAAQAGEALSDDLVLLDAAAGPDTTPGDGGGTLLVRRPTPARLDLEVHVAQPTWIVLRVPYYRGWRASIDGRSVPLVRAGGFFMALRTPAGRHDIVVRYAEPGLLAGGLVAVAVLVLLPLVLTAGSRLDGGPCTGRDARARIATSGARLRRLGMT